MTRLQLNKSSLANQANNLRTFKRFLPSLDLKRQKLMAERNSAKVIVEQTIKHIAQLELRVADTLPMLANQDIDLSGLVRIRKVHIESENLVGIQLPIMKGIDIEVKTYSAMVMPHWVDNVVVMLKQTLELKMLLKVEKQRLSVLDAAAKTITQRVNLFDKVLIPKTQDNIKRIKIYLSDEQMAAVVRSKIAKRKRQNMVAS